MKLLFIHDHRFKEIDKRIYSTGGLPNEVLSRYTDIFGEMTVAARIEHGERNAHMSEIVNPAVKVIDTYREKKVLLSLIDESDCVIVRLPSLQGNRAMNFLKKSGKPYLIELVGCPWDAFWNHSFRGKIAAPYMWYVTKKTVINAPFVSYVSEKFLQRRYPTRGAALACSDVDLPSQDESALEKRLKRIEHMPEKKIILGTVANADVRYKGQQYVIRAMAELADEGYDFEYRLAGGGSGTYLKKLAEKYGVSDKVIFCGFLPHDKVYDFMDSIDVYVQPSNAESHGRVILEAMSRACPAIGSSTGGIPELVQQEFVFKRKSVKDLKRCLRLCTRQTLLECAQYSARKITEFTPQRLNEKRKTFYKLLKEQVCADD